MVAVVIQGGIDYNDSECTEKTRLLLYRPCVDGRDGKAQAEMGRHKAHRIRS